MTASVAEQIAQLLNDHNDLKTEYSGHKVLRSKARYLPEQHKGLVFGSVAVHRMTFMLSEIKHLVVHQSFRGLGLGKLLLRKAEAEVDTPLIYATVREGNAASIELFTKFGFKEITRVWVDSHRVLLLMKINVAHRKNRSRDNK